MAAMLSDVSRETITVLPLDPSVVSGFWPVMEPMLRAAVAHSRNRFTLPEIQADVMAGNKRLWAVCNGVHVISAIVTVIKTFSTQRVCTILLCGGADLDSWVKPVLAEIEKSALADGCAAVDIVGREGWSRKCPGYAAQGVWLVKELPHRQPEVA